MSRWAIQLPTSQMHYADARAKRWIVAIVCLLAGMLSPSVAAANSGVATVSFTGLPSDPEVHITGEGFGTLPVASNLAYQGYTGYDYGEALYICDASQNPNTFCAGEGAGAGSGDAIGLAISMYSGAEIAYSLGSTYANSYYPANTYRLQQGDSVTVHISSLTCSGRVDYGGTPIACNSAPTEGPSVPPTEGASVPLTEGAGLLPTERLVSPTNASETTTSALTTPSGKRICGRVAAAAGRSSGESTPAGRKWHRHLLYAAAKLGRVRFAHVQIAVAICGQLAESLGVVSGEVLRGTGDIDLEHNRARWSVALPSSLGSEAIKVIVDRGTTYVMLGDRTAGLGQQWVRLARIELHTLPELGFAGALATLLNPTAAAHLIKSTAPSAARTGSRAAIATRSTSAKATGPATCRASRSTAFEAPLRPTSTTSAHQTEKSWDGSINEALSAFRDVRVVGGVTDRGLLDELTLVASDGQRSGLSATFTYCQVAEPADYQDPQASSLANAGALGGKLSGGSGHAAVG